MPGRWVINPRFLDVFRVITGNIGLKWVKIVLFVFLYWVSQFKTQCFKNVLKINSKLISFLELYKIHMVKFYLFENSHWRCSVRKGVLRNFAKFTQISIKFFRTLFLQNTSGRLLLILCFILKLYDIGKLFV